VAISQTHVACTCEGNFKEDCSCLVVGIG